MSDSDDDRRTATGRFPPNHQMGFDDFDLEASWLDSLLFAATPPSSFVSPAASDQPCSPLWAFSDEDRLVIKRAPNSVAENPGDNDERMGLPSPLPEVMLTSDPDGYWVIKERMARALRYLKEWSDQHVLAQVWAPVKKADHYVLTTSGQPFVIDPRSQGLRHYRMVSMMYMFSVDGESEGELGLPGRVFRQKLPEWTPNVQYYSSREFPRLNDALHDNVQGTLALPVFEQTGHYCVGVLELILTSQKIHYAPEVHKVCKALQAVNLKSSEILDPPGAQVSYMRVLLSPEMTACIFSLRNPILRHLLLQICTWPYFLFQICNESRQNALAEILEILTVICEAHQLPLAQTWVPCRHRSVLACGGGLKKSCTSFDGSCMGKVCMSTTDVAFYVVDAHMWGFREACVEHHMQKGQGVAGRAFSSQNACFCTDITQFCKTDYPLVHYARMFGLTSCFAICLRSTHTGDDNYVLEFFLPAGMKDGAQCKDFLRSLVATIREHLKSLKVASGVELEDDDAFIEIIQGFADERLGTRLKSGPTIPSTMASPLRPGPSQNGHELTLLQNLNQQMDLKFEQIADGGDVGAVNEGDTSAHALNHKDVEKTSKRKRGKTMKTISIDVLQQHFAGSLKDAAKSLGVCPTTMKRICRQHGISRWPSRKINKVNRSLTKLKRVIESVQGAEGALGLPPLSTSPHAVAVGSISWPSLNVSNQRQTQNCKLSQSQVEENDSPARTRNDGQGLIVDQRVDGSSSNPDENFPHCFRFSPEFGNSANQSRSQSASREGSIEAPASLCSCRDSAVNEVACTKDQQHSHIHQHQQCFAVRRSPEAFQLTKELSIPAAFSLEDALMTMGPLEPFGGFSFEHTDSSKDLTSLIGKEPLCSNQFPKQATASVPQEMPLETCRQEKGASIKANYRDDIIRFRISFQSGIDELREQVAKRLKLEVGTFDIKYLDDDDEWVLIACDADLQECLDISRSSRSMIIRLSVHDTVPNLGSSCESTGEL